MSKRVNIFTALGGLSGAGLYLVLRFWFDSWLHLIQNDLPRLILGLVLSAALGCMAGVSTHPFADDGRSLLRESLLHYLVTAILFAALLWSIGVNAPACCVWVGILTVLYLGIWLARWIGWYMEIMQIRELLGLAPGHSP